MKRKSYIKATLSGFVWGLGQLFNKQYLKALFFFTVFAFFIGLELGTSNYFYKEKYENDIAFQKIPGSNFGDSWFEAMPTSYIGYLADARPADKDKVRNTHFEDFMIEIGAFAKNQSTNEVVVLDSSKFTEQLALEFFAREFQEISPSIYTNLVNGDVIQADDISSDYYNIVTNAILYYNDQDNKFYYERNYSDENNVSKREYIETNLFTNEPIENPEILDSKEGLIRFQKTRQLHSADNLFYLEVNYDEGDDQEKRYYQINKDNKLIEYTGIALRKFDTVGPIYVNDTNVLEYYQAGLLHNGYRMQYKESTIMYTFRRMMDQTFRTPGNKYKSTDVEKLMLRIHFEMNPEIKEEYVNYFNNFFSDRAGIFVKGYWSVVTLGTAKKQNYTSYMALKDNIVGDKNSAYNITEHVRLVESIPIEGHISTILLIEGLIAVLLSLFFFIFMIWSIIDAFRISERKREEEEIETTKEYFKSVWDNGFEYIVLSPALFVLAFISIMPILFGFIMAFTSISGAQSMVDNFDYVGLKNFFALFNFKSGLGSSFGKAFWSVLWWTIIWAVLSTATVFFGGFIQAMVLNSEKVVFRKFWRTILILPWAIPALLSQMVFSVMFKETGFINQVLRDAGLYNIFINMGILGKPFSQVTGIAKYFWLGHENIQWFSNSFNIPFVRGTLVVVNIWLGFPYFMALMTGIMTAIDKTLYEAADIDGATGMQKTMKITVPLVLYSTAPILIMTFSGNFNNFGVIYFITGGGPNAGLASKGYAGSTDILISWMYSLTVDHNIYNMASVFSVLVFLFVGSITAWNLSKTRAFQGD